MIQYINDILIFLMIKKVNVQFVLKKKIKDFVKITNFVINVVKIGLKKVLCVPYTD